MANCNECLHGDVCERFTDNVAIICKRFKHDNDYAEVKHGEWEEVQQVGKNSRHIKYTTKKCSVCGYWNGRRKTNYCPNCGAKMDLKEGDTE